jgi:hypothetical protein
MTKHECRMTKSRLPRHWSFGHLVIWSFFRHWSFVIGHSFVLGPRSLVRRPRFVSTRLPALPIITFVLFRDHRGSRLLLDRKGRKARPAMTPRWSRARLFPPAGPMTRTVERRRRPPRIPHRVPAPGSAACRLARHPAPARYLGGMRFFLPAPNTECRNHRSHHCACVPIFAPSAARGVPALRLSYALPGILMQRVESANGAGIVLRGDLNWLSN